MILDERTYTVKPGELDRYLKAHKSTALPIMRRYLGEPYGYFVTETGGLNQFVHLWRYDSMADREARRVQMYQNAEWLEYHRVIGEAGLVVGQCNRILRAIDIPSGERGTP